jgi:hypothetical protein
MVTTGIIISFITGFVMLNAVSFRFSILEKIGLSFLLGMASQTLLMCLLDAFCIPLTIINIFIATALLIAGLSVKLFLNRKTLVFDRQNIVKKITATASSLNLVWLLFIILIVWLEYMNYAKCIYFPTFDRDSIAGFDTIGMAIAGEHTIRNLSIFQNDYMPGIHGPGSYITYMPMTQLSYAYVYMLGAATSKIIPALIYLCFLISFYAVIVRFAGHTAAAVAVFFVLITPEMIAFSSLSGTNVIHAVYVSLGIIYTVLWLKNKDKSAFILSMLLTAFGLWVRNESLAFSGAAVLVVLIYNLKSRNWKNIILYAVVILLPLIFWTVYTKIHALQAESIIIAHPFWDGAKAGVIWTYFKMLLTNQQYYGLSFAVFLIAVILNIYNMAKRKDMPAIPGIVLLSLLFYIILLYQIDYKWDSLENVLASSAKRFIFCFIPLLWMYSVTNYWSILLFGKLDKALCFCKSQEQFPKKKRKK